MICAQCTEELPDDARLCGSCGDDPILEGFYRLDSVVGHGANGTTYRATRLSDGETVAIKELLVRKVESLKAIELFQRETEVLEQLEHHGIPEYYDDLNVDAGRSVALYLVQEFIDGETLADEFSDRRATPEQVFEIAAELLDTLSYLHGLTPPVIHRDIKPGNVMRRGSDGKLVLIDFGAVRDAVDTDEGGSTVAGTFGYMAPEQFMGRAIPATDIYGVGATIVAMLAREDPQKLVGADRTIEWEGRFDLNPALTWILRQMLQADPERRANDAAEVARQIRAALAGELRQDPVPSQQPSGRSLPASFLGSIPPATRELPKNFKSTYATYAKFAIPFGAVFTVVGVVSAAAGVPAAFGAGDALMGIVFGLCFLAAFGGTGIHFLSKGWKRLNSLKAAYMHGEPVVAMVVKHSRSSYSVNDNRAHIYTYEFVTEGHLYSGDFHTWDPLDLEPGDEVAVLAAPGDPTSNLLWQPSQYNATMRAQRQVRERVRQEVTFSYPDEEPAPMNVTDEAAAQPASTGGDWA